MNVSDDNARDISEVLGLGEPPRGRKRVRLAMIASALGIIVAAGVWYSTARNDAAVQYTTAAVTRGDLTVMVTATGTVQPVNQVDVGTEISGTIKTVEADYNDRVKAGQVPARLDTDKLQSQVQSQSTLESAQTGGSLLSRLFPRPPYPSRSRDTEDAKGKRQRVYVLRDSQPSAVPVTAGATNGVMTEITGGDITIGTEVVTDMISASQ